MNGSMIMFGDIYGSFGRKKNGSVNFPLQSLSSRA